MTRTSQITGKVSGRGAEHIAENELACSVILRNCGIETARVTRVPDIPGSIAISRYDRIWTNGGDGRRVMRLHQEDFCQALGFPTYLKYQPQGLKTSYLSLVAQLMDETTAIAQNTKEEFAKRLVLNFVIGNADNHLKNSSLLYNTSWTRRSLAPAYDITCIPLTGHSTNMAYDIGRHRTLDDIDERDIGTIADELEISPTALQRAINEVLEGLSTTAAGSIEDADASTVKEILADAAPRAKVLERTSLL